MLELHGWITFRETYEAVEDCPVSYTHLTLPTIA